jgi:hypothetical protein
MFIIIIIIIIIIVFYSNNDYTNVPYCCVRRKLPVLLYIKVKPLVVALRMCSGKEFALRKKRAHSDSETSVSVCQLGTLSDQFLLTYSTLFNDEMC